MTRSVHRANARRGVSLKKSQQFLKRKVEKQGAKHKKSRPSLTTRKENRGKHACSYTQVRFIISDAHGKSTTGRVFGWTRVDFTSAPARRERRRRPFSESPVACFSALDAYRIRICLLFPLCPPRVHTQTRRSPSFAPRRFSFISSACVVREKSAF